MCVRVWGERKAIRMKAVRRMTHDYLPLPADWLLGLPVREPRFRDVRSEQIMKQTSSLAVTSDCLNG